MIKSKLKSYITSKSLLGLSFLDRFVFDVFLVKSLYRMPLGKYIDVVVDGDLSVLSSAPFRLPKRTLVKCFNKLQLEYAALSGLPVGQQDRITKNDDINFIQFQLFFFSHALKLLIAKKGLEDVRFFLGKNGFYGTDEELINALSGELMGLKSSLDDLKATVEAPEEDVKKVSRADYAKTIAIANKNGYKLDYSSSVADFVLILGLQKEEIKRLKSR